MKPVLSRTEIGQAVRDHWKQAEENEPGRADGKGADDQCALPWGKGRRGGAFSRVSNHLTALMMPGAKICPFALAFGQHQRLSMIYETA